MADTATVVTALRDYLAAQRESEPSIAEYGEHTENRLTSRLSKLLDAGWIEERFLPGVEKSPLPGLRLLSEQQRRQLTFDLIPIRAAGEPRLVRAESILVGLETGDARRLLDGLWTYGRLNLADSVFSSGGYDHCFYFFDHLEAIAVGDLDLAAEIFPESTPPTKRGYRFYVVATNLVRALRHAADPDPAREDAHKFLTTKSAGAFESFLAEYLLGLVDDDVDAATRLLEQISRTWSSTPWARTFARDPLHKTASLKLLGLVRLGESVAPGLAEIAATSPAWNVDLVALLADDDARNQPRQSVVRFTGASASLGAFLTPRPFQDYAARTA